MGRETCPHCSASIGSEMTVCPNCRIAIIRKSRAILYLIIGCIIFATIVAAFFLLFLPAPQSVTQSMSQPVPKPSAIPAAADAQAALLGAAEIPGQSPPCTLAITGSRTPPDTIRLQVMTSTCSAGDVTRLRVRINGEEKGTLDPGPGSSGTFTGTSGADNVVVAAAFSNGAESVVYQNAAL